MIQCLINKTQSKAKIYKYIKLNLDFKMTTLNNIIKRAMSLMKAHVQYSQSLATEFSHLIKDFGSGSRDY